MEPPKHKRSKKKLLIYRKNCDIDRLSFLPDSILAHVLSFLDTISAVRTSVLSRRYRFLWTLSPSLDFSFSDYRTDRFESYDGRVFNPVKNTSLVSFESYVIRVLLLREHSNLVRFRMSLHKYVTSEFMATCIEYAARHKVQHLKLRGFVQQNPVVLPKILINSSFLTSLHLLNGNNNSIELPKSVHLPGLKLLRLKNFEFCDTNFNGEIFTGCSNLEALFLGKCSIRPGNKLKCLDVGSLNLRSLEIRCWRSPWKCFDEHVINVRSPRLEFFSLQGHLAKVNLQGGSPCVREACVDLAFPTACAMVNTGERKRKTLDGLLDMLQQICNLKFLSLSLRTFEVMTAPIDSKGSTPIIFENLRVVRFTCSNKYAEVKMPADAVSRLLERVVNDVLIFDGCKEKRHLPESSKSKKKETRSIAVPVHVLQFLLQVSPSLELFAIEIPKESQGQE